MSWLKLLSVTALCFTALVESKSKGLQLVQEWKEMEFVFPDEEAKERAIEMEYYIPGKSFPLDVDPHYVDGELDRIFVTFPRLGKGRPITLGVVEEDGKVRGYPDYASNDNQGNNCDGITSVFRTAIDRCHRLWVMDTGKIGKESACGPQLLIYDLKTDRMIKRFRFPVNLIKPESMFVTPVVDIRRNCNSFSGVYVYVADSNGYSLAVINLKNGDFSTLTHELFRARKDNTTFTIEGESFVLMAGLAGLALSPYKPQEDRTLYFHALASISENYVKTSVIQDSTFSEESDAYADNFHSFRGKRPNQAVAEAIDKDGIMYFGIMDPPSILCWDTATKFDQSNFHPIDLNRTNLQFAGGVKIVTKSFSVQELWVSTCRIQKVYSGTLSNNEVNFRLLKGKVSDLLADSPCKRPEQLSQTDDDVDE